MRIRVLYTLSLILIINIFSCQRDKLIIEDSCNEVAKIPIRVDYSLLNERPKNMTLLFYDRKDGTLALEHRYENNDKEVQSYVYLPIGEYDVVVFNELRDQVKNVRTLDYEKISTLTKRTMSTNPVRTRSKNQRYIAKPGMLGVVKIDELIVTEEMIDYSHGRPISKGASSQTKAMSEKLMGVVLSPKVSTMKIKVHIKGLHNALMPALVDLRGIAGEYYPLTDKNGTEAVTKQFLMNNRVYDEGSKTDGTISTTVSFKGLLGERNTIADQPADTPIELDLLFKLVDNKTEASRKVDITRLVEFDDEISGSISLVVNIEVSEALPETKPAGGDPGFGSGVDPWDDPIVVPL